MGLSLVFAGCSIRSLAVNALADSLAASGDVFASDEDPELVREALPFALKTLESLLAEKPHHAGLLLSSCKGFTQYAYAFIEADASYLEDTDYSAAMRGYDRALRMYLRARGYCIRALELGSPGIEQRLQSHPEQALDSFSREHVPLLFWTAASWGGAIYLGLDRPEIVADLPAVRALIDRSLELDESWDQGAIHGVLITLEALPEAMGGSAERAREHFDRAVQLSKGMSAGPYVTLAESVSVPAQDFREFESLLESALAIDPDAEPSLRLMNLIIQKRARWLLGRLEELFLDYGEASAEG